MWWAGLDGLENLDHAGGVSARRSTLASAGLQRAGLEDVQQTSGSAISGDADTPTAASALACSRVLGRDVVGSAAGAGRLFAEELFLGHSRSRFRGSIAATTERTE